MSNPWCTRGREGGGKGWHSPAVYDVNVLYMPRSYIAGSRLETRRNARSLVTHRRGHFSCKFDREIDGNFSKTISTARLRLGHVHTRLIYRANVAQPRLIVLIDRV